MLIAGIALGLLLGLLLGGRIERLADIRLRFLPLLFLGVILRFGTEALLAYDVPIVNELRLPLFGLAYGLLLITLWQNRAYPGLALAFVGVASNALVIMVNGGYMPVWLPAYEASGLSGPLGTVLHTPLPATLGSEFLLHLGPLGDLIPLPLPPFQNVASIGDLFLTAGPLLLPVLHRPQRPGERPRRDRRGQGRPIDRHGRRATPHAHQRADRDPRSPERRGAGRRGGYGAPRTEPSPPGPSSRQARRSPMPCCARAPACPRASRKPRSSSGRGCSVVAASAWRIPR